MVYNEQMEHKKLKLFESIPSNKVGVATNILLGCLRAGGKSQDDLYHYLENEKFKRDRWGGDEIVDKLFDLVSWDADNCVEEAIEYYLEWEKLSHEEKDRIKRSRGAEYATQSMAGKPPTEKQIAYIKSKGKTVPSDRLEASKLIDILING